MVEYVTEEELTRERLDEEDFKIVGVGWVRIRSLSREEVMLVRKATDNAESIDGPRALVLERKMLAAAVVKPTITEAVVGRWQKASKAGELDPVANRIQELSGMLEGSAKAAYKSVRGEPGDGVRALPGGEAEHDGGPAAG